MAKFTKESIQRLRDAVDIVDVISRSIPLKKMGGAMKGLCPFHAEKTPSFTVNRASRHYHCFGCGAHGDSVSFLMQHEGMSFTQALLFLSERFQITLEEDMTKGSSSSVEDGKKYRLKALLEKACQFFHAILLYSEEAALAREYLAHRGISLSFVRAFLVGFLPQSSAAPSILQRYLRANGFTDEEMVQAGLIISGKEGRFFDFFSQRITFPILDQAGAPIGFSARKFSDATYGGKYINTSETLLFKKSRILFGLPYSKKRIVKDRNVIVVEGQLDALQLIHNGFDYTVATLGTAFGDSHVEILKMLGVENAYIAFDSDQAGVRSAIKAGDLLMKKGISVFHVRMDNAKDPDEFLIKYGRSQFLKALFHAPEHIDFCLEQAQKAVDWSSASEKEKALRRLVAQIQEWDNSLLIHESLKHLSHKTGVPLEFLSGGNSAGLKASLPISGTTAYKSQITEVVKEIPVVGRSHGKSITIDSDTELELDLLRWLIMLGEELESITKNVLHILSEDDFTTKIGRELFRAFFQLQNSNSVSHMSLIDLAGELNCDETEEAYLQYMLQKPPIRLEKAHQYIHEAIRKLKERKWMRMREDIRKRMVEQADSLSEQDQMRLLEEFSSLKMPSIPSFEDVKN